jgi:hypothetical protein
LAALIATLLERQRSEMKDAKGLSQPPPKSTRKTPRQQRWREPGEVEMRERLKNCGLALGLFVFLFVVSGGGLHLNVAGAFVGAVTATPLVIYAFHNGLRRASPRYNVHFDSKKCEAAHVGSTSTTSD